MKRLAICSVLLLSIGLCIPVFAQNSQVYWHDQSQKQAQKLQKKQQKAYNHAVKQQQKLMKKQQKQARKDIKASHYPKGM